MGTQVCFSWVFPSQDARCPPPSSALESITPDLPFRSMGKPASRVAVGGKPPPHYRCSQPLFIFVSASLHPCLRPTEFICLRLRNPRAICPPGSLLQTLAVAPRVLPACRRAATLLGQSPLLLLAGGLALLRRVGSAPACSPPGECRSRFGRLLHAGAAVGHTAVMFPRLTFLIEGEGVSPPTQIFFCISQ